MILYVIGFCEIKENSSWVHLILKGLLYTFNKTCEKVIHEWLKLGTIIQAYNNSV
jgi:hypothetical protein